MTKVWYNPYMWKNTQTGKRTVREMSEAEKKKDRRVIRTKKAIRGAFAKLIVEKDAAKITIKEIAEIADVDRKTIYNYYASIYEIWEDLESELIANFEKITENVRYDIEKPQQVFEVLVRLISENMEMYSLLLQSRPDPRITGKLYTCLRGKVLETIETSQRVKADRVELAADFITGAIYSCYHKWFMDGRKMPLEEITESLGDMIVNGVSAYLIRD